MGDDGVAATEWPVWAVRSFLGLFVVWIILTVLSSKATATTCSSTPEFKKFQFNYLTVYLLIMLADWLQGTNMYTLYQSYGVNVASLFLTGFTSSAFFSVFIGTRIDSFGRKKACIVFCILEIIIQLLEHIPVFWVLIVGRLMGGLSTALLFTAFEAWMVTEHRKQGFSEEQLMQTFSYGSVGNGIVAIMAGLTAQYVADMLGDIGPFQLALALTVVALVLVAAWPENYGENEQKGGGGGGEASTDRAGVLANIGAGLGEIFSNRDILLCGLTQSLFEGAMYTFVFMWVPVMQPIVPDGVLPTGLVFSCFMAAVSIGGVLFGPLSRVAPVERTAAVVFAVAAMAMMVPLYSNHYAVVFVSFLVLELCVGLFYPGSGAIRSRHLPSGSMATIMNLFRVPLNALVVTGTKLADGYPASTVFSVCACWFALGSVLQASMRVPPPTPITFDTTAVVEGAEDRSSKKEKTREGGSKKGTRRSKKEQ